MEQVDDTWSQNVAASVRAELARRRLRARDLMPVLGLGRSATYARVNGTVPFDTAQLIRVATHLGMSVEALVRDADRRARHRPAGS